MQVYCMAVSCSLAQVYVAYACNITEPGHGNAGPLAVGLAVWALTEAGQHRRKHVGVLPSCFEQSAGAGKQTG